MNRYSFISNSYKRPKVIYPSYTDPETGNKYWFKNNKFTENPNKSPSGWSGLHRVNGPAIEWANGDKSWYLNGKLHRIDGPAAEGIDGHKSWYLNGKRHRTDGPAIEWANGDKEWYLNGRRHRIDGPAVEYPNGTKSWYLNGVYLTEEQFNTLVQKNNH